MKEIKRENKIDLYFILSILGILISLYSALNCVEYGKQGYEETIKMLPSLSDRFSSPNYFIVIFAIFSVVSCIMFMYILFSSINNKISERKGKIVALSIFGLILSVSYYAQLIWIVTLIFILTVKGIKTKKEKEKEIPKINYSTDKYLPGIKGIILCIVLLAVYFSQLIFTNYLPNNKTIVRIVGISFYIVMLILCITVFRKEIGSGFKKFKENFKAYVGFSLRKYAMFWILYLIASIVSMSITHSETSINQSLLEKLPLWYLVPTALIYAPIVEETLFRGCLRRLFGKNNIVFIIISGAVFGWLHAMDEVGLINIIVTSLPYAVLGSCFAYVYTKTNNITCNMFLHFAHNSIAVIMMILMRLF
jgi:membrane protease YdiL (CAAX protease family)